MARTIRITKPGGTKSTFVEVFENGALDHSGVFNERQDFYSGGVDRISFPNNEFLDKMVLRVSNLHADTDILLGAPATENDLVAAMVANKFFHPDSV